MEERTVVIRSIRLFCSLVLGLGLVLGLLWVLTPRSTVEAQAIEPAPGAGLTKDVHWRQSDLRALPGLDRALRGTRPDGARKSPPPGKPH